MIVSGSLGQKQLILDDSLNQGDYQPGAITMSTAVTPANGSAPL